MNDNSTSISDQIKNELSKKLFYLKTLYDVSRELIGMDSIESIMRNFILMSTGNFGVLEGFIFLYDRRAGVADKLEIVGIPEDQKILIEKASGRLLAMGAYHQEDLTTQIPDQDKKGFPAFIDQVFVFKISDTCAGILGLGAKIVGDPYAFEDLNLLETLVNNLVAALKNAYATEALKDAYNEVSSSNRAKDKVINHLSHELKTPIAILVSSLALLNKALLELPDENWKRVLERAQRSLERLSDLQQEVEDIMQIETYESHRMICRLLDQCTDELETLATEQAGKASVVDCIRQRIDEIFGLEENMPEEIDLVDFVRTAVRAMAPDISHRQLKLDINSEYSPKIRIPGQALTKVVKGLIKNAIENTPDQGKIQISMMPFKGGAALEIHDFGVGILPDHRMRIFEGFFPTQETSQYASKQPYDFNAGGKGADLLRMKIFAERYGFVLDFESDRCRHLMGPADVCPGAIDKCRFCNTPGDCLESGGSTFRVIFASNNNSQ